MSEKPKIGKIRGRNPIGTRLSVSRQEQAYLPSGSCPMATRVCHRGETRCFPDKPNYLVYGEDIVPRLVHTGLYCSQIIIVMSEEAPQKLDVHTTIASVDIDPKAERALVWKFDLRLLPVLAIMYLFNSLDKSNLGNAKTAGLEGMLSFFANFLSFLVIVIAF